MQLLELGRLLRIARQNAGISQFELARTLGMSRATISAIECGRCTEIGFAKLAALLERVGLELRAAPRQRRPTIDELIAERRAK